jgi:fatty acid desaturase
LNEIFGTVCFLPILLPLESWRLHHNEGVDELTADGVREYALSPLYWIRDFLKGYVLHIGAILHRRRRVSSKPVARRFAQCFSFCSCGF